VTNEYVYAVLWTDLVQLRSMPTKASRSAVSGREELSESLRQETADAIEDLISRGEPDAVADADVSVLVECARRFLASAIQQRSRQTVRAREAYVSERDKITARLRAKASLIVSEMAEHLHAEWTADLLASSFALPNGGGTVTFAEATSQQHAVRADYLSDLAAGDMRTAALHRRAMQDIAAASVGSLGEIHR